MTEEQIQLETDQEFWIESLMDGYVMGIIWWEEVIPQSLVHAPTT